MVAGPDTSIDAERALLARYRWRSVREEQLTATALFGVLGIGLGFAHGLRGVSATDVVLSFMGLLWFGFIGSPAPSWGWRRAVGRTPLVTQAVQRESRRRLWALTFAVPLPLMVAAVLALGLDQPGHWMVAVLWLGLAVGSALRANWVRREERRRRAVIVRPLRRRLGSGYDLYRRVPTP